MKIRYLRLCALAGAVALSLGIASCSTTEEDVPAPEADDSSAAVAVEDGEAPDDEDSYAFGTDREQIAEAIESAFATKNGTATWEGDTLVLSIDGDIEEAIAAFTPCQVLVELLNEGDRAEIAFPGGRVDCAEVLE